MLKLDRKAFGGLGNHVKFNVPGTKAVDLHTGDAVINEAFGVFTYKRRVFTQDEMQAAVSAGVDELRKADPDWQLTAHPALHEWLRYELLEPATQPAAAPQSPVAAPTEDSPAVADAPAAKKSKKKPE